MLRTVADQVLRCCIVVGLCSLAWGVTGALPGRAAEEGSDAPPAPELLTLEDAVNWALVHNPEIAALRQQHGIAAAAVVIARTYPFNPVSENRIQNNDGPASAGITNRVALENLLLWEVELHHQGSYRREAALAALGRTDWEIAGQEQALAVRVIRAFVTLLYRQEKFRLIEETIRLNEEMVKTAGRLFEANRLRSADLQLAQTEVDSALAVRALGETNLVAARYDLRRALGAVDECMAVQGVLEAPMPAWDACLLLPMALDRRADLRAHEAAVAETEARVQLEIANRHGNPIIGAAYTYDPTRINLIGGQINFPIPVCNLHRGEIQQREAEKGRAVLELRQTEVQVHQDVQAGLARLAAAASWVDTYRDKILPNLRKALENLEKLFREGDPGVDVLRVIDVRRKLIQARDNYLDALWEVRQAQADLAAAVGDPALAIYFCTAPPVPCKPDGEKACP